MDIRRRKDGEASRYGTEKDIEKKFGRMGLSSPPPDKAKIPG